MGKNKQLWAQKRRQVLELLKTGGAYRYSELVRVTRIAEKTMDRILADLRSLGLIEKRHDGYWAWFEHIRKRYKTKDEKDDDLEHSRLLISGLESILAEDRHSHPDALKAEAEGSRILDDPMWIKKLAEEHLKTGYPSQYRKLEEYRALRADIRHKLEQKKYPKRIVSLIVDGMVTFPRNVDEIKGWPWNWKASPPKDLIGVLDQKLKAYSELEHEIHEIELLIHLRKPLDGCCQACKSVGVGRA